MQIHILMFWNREFKEDSFFFLIYVFFFFFDSDVDRKSRQIERNIAQLF